jgi:hypothetical protein
MRRFSEQELKLHRDNVYQAVREGKLVPEEQSEVRTVASRPIREIGLPNLIPEAVTLLISAAQGDGFVFDQSGIQTYGFTYTRERATQYEAFQQLRRSGFIRHDDGDSYVLTSQGYSAADGYLALLNEKPA